MEAEFTYRSFNFSSAKTLDKQAEPILIIIVNDSVVLNADNDFKKTTFGKALFSNS